MCPTKINYVISGGGPGFGECIKKMISFDSLNPSFWHVQLIIASHITNCIVDFGLNALKHVFFFCHFIVLMHVHTIYSIYTFFLWQK